MFVFFTSETEQKEEKTCSQSWCVLGGFESHSEVFKDALFKAYFATA